MDKADYIWVCTNCLLEFDVDNDPELNVIMQSGHRAIVLENNQAHSLQFQKWETFKRKRELQNRALTNRPVKENENEI